MPMIEAKVTMRLPAQLCEILEKELGIPGNAVYISYWGTSNWGWNGGNFQAAERVTKDETVIERAFTNSSAFGGRTLFVKVVPDEKWVSAVSLGIDKNSNIMIN